MITDSGQPDNRDCNMMVKVQVEIIGICIHRLQFDRSVVGIRKCTKYQKENENEILENARFNQL